MHSKLAATALENRTRAGGPGRQIQPSAGAHAPLDPAGVVGEESGSRAGAPGLGSL
jgi:hypothetical protein